MSDINNTGLSLPQLKALARFFGDTTKIPVLGAGGGFAPIGKEGYIDGTLAPQGWLICDGSTHNIADYPDLAAYYASHHGASNYYGGDGITTFAVPVRNGMPNGGVETPDEHIVGEWRETIDGVLKKKPVYEKTLYVSSTVSGTYTLLISSGIKDIIKCDIFAKDANNNIAIIPNGNPTSAYNSQAYINTSGQIVMSNGGSISYHDLIIVARYTKTSDDWQTVQEGHSADGNGIFCVKATVSGDANAHQYSTEEQIVGMTEDGKTIYEKTITGLSAATTWSQQYEARVTISFVTLGLSNIDFVRSATAYGTYQSGKYMYPASAVVDGTNITFGVHNAFTISKLTIQYTKTSS